MIILVIGSLLLGAILGRFFNVRVLAPAFALSLAMVVAGSAYFGHSLLRALLEFAVLITSLQIGYVSGVLSFLIPSVSQRQGTMAALRMSRRKTQHSARSFQVRDSAGAASFIHREKVTIDREND